MFSLKGKYRRALVSGGAGFIGSHLVEEILADGLEVISIDNYAAGKKSNLAPFHRLYPKAFREVDCDITDYDKLRQEFDGVDIVFHEAASKMTVCLENPRRDLAVNAEGTFNLLELSRDFGVKKFVHGSTGSVYGKAEFFPTDEQHPLNPVSYYGVSKLAGEKYARAFSDLYNLDVTILRYFHVYGPRQEFGDYGGVVAIFGRRAVQDNPLIIFGDGLQVRSFTYVKDVVNANKLVALNDGTKGESYNCASGIRVSIQELADRTLQYFGKPQLGIQYDPPKIGDIKDFNVSNQKLTKLGFKDFFSFDEGHQKTLEWVEDYLK